jgi:LacI family transcriptional regulator
MSARIEDVAKAAGVSTATVSRVMNNDSHAVRAATRRRVEDAVRKLDYKPNIFARGLMKGTTNSVGLIVPFLSNPYHTEIVDAIVESLARHDVFVYLCCSYARAELEQEYVRSLGHRRVDALIVVESPAFNSRRAQAPEAYSLPGQPTILVNEHLAMESPHHIVRCAQEPGILQAFERFRSLGRERIALFRGGVSYSFELKEQLFRTFLTSNGLPPKDNPVVRIRNANDPRAVHDSAVHVGELLRGARPPRAVLASNDLIALGVVQGALAAGARIPEDLAVISVDNTIVSQFSRPPLSVVDLRMKTVGTAAARAYLDLRANGFRADTPLRHSIDAQLIVRDTG